MKKTVRLWAVAAITGLLLAACGGDDSSITKVKVMGDSLADVGTFNGLKFTVQGGKVYPERVAQTYGISTMCNFFSFTGATFVPNPTAGCTNFAIGGGVVNGAGSGYAAADPRNIDTQFQAAVAGGDYAADELVVIDGGGNDAAALVSAYLGAASGSPVAVGAYSTLLSTVLDPAVVAAQLNTGAAGFANVGGLYMAALATRFHGQIKDHVIDRGAKRVVVLNMPGITNTPRFQAVLDSIGAVQGPAGRASAEGLFKNWISAFNGQLAASFNGNRNVVLVDFYTAFNDQVANPAKYQLSNVVTPACPAVGVGSDGLPVYDFPNCTEANLAANPPAGAGVNWWKSYAFSDGFHPTPYGHELLTREITKALKKAGWL